MCSRYGRVSTRMPAANRISHKTNTRNEEAPSANRRPRRGAGAGGFALAATSNGVGVATVALGSVLGLAGLNEAGAVAMRAPFSVSTRRYAREPSIPSRRMPASKRAE